jgi:hypothetical protein
MVRFNERYYNTLAAICKKKLQYIEFFREGAGPESGRAEIDQRLGISSQPLAVFNLWPEC